MRLHLSPAVMPSGKPAGECALEFKEVLDRWWAAWAHRAFLNSLPTPEYDWHDLEAQDRRSRGLR